MIGLPPFLPNLSYLKDIINLLSYVFYLSIFWCYIIAILRDDKNKAKGSKKNEKDIRNTR